jgi:hypothetical protein
MIGFQTGNPLAILDELRTLAAPVTTFFSGGKFADRSQAMDQNLKDTIMSQYDKTGIMSGNIGYSDFDKSQTPGAEFPNLDAMRSNLFSGDMSLPAFSNATTLGRVNYDIDPNTGKVNFGSNEYNFRPEMATIDPSDPYGQQAFSYFAGKANERNREINPDISIPVDYLRGFGRDFSQFGDIPTKEERQGIESFNNLVSARNNQADILQIINQMEEEKKNYYTQPEEQPDFIDTVLSSLQKGAQYYGGSQIGAGLGSLSGLGPLGIAIGALTGGKFFGGADTSMTPMDRYNQNTFGGYGNMGIQDRYGINTVSFFGDYNRYANKMANKPGPFQSYYQDVVNKQNKQEAQQFADIRQQSESSGGYNPSTGYTAETASGLEGTGGSHHGYSTDYSSPF